MYSFSLTTCPLGFVGFYKPSNASMVMLPGQGLGGRAALGRADLPDRHCLSVALGRIQRGKVARREPTRFHPARLPKFNLAAALDMTWGRIDGSSQDWTDMHTGHHSSLSDATSSRRQWRDTNAIRHQSDGRKCPMMRNSTRDES